MTAHAILTREFPDFDLATLPTIPEGFTCTAWHNDSCPTWHEGESAREPLRGELMLAIDYADATLREYPETERFHLHIYPANDCSPEPLLSSDDWQKIEAAIYVAREIRRLGLGFHPDTRGRDYVWTDPRRADPRSIGSETMANMARKEGPGDYQIGIWSVRREGKQWLAQATGPGTIGDGSPHHYPTLAAAHLALTGESRRQYDGTLDGMGNRLDGEPR